MGQALIILVGGFDLSVGASVSLVNAILATTMAATVGAELSWGVAALAIGGLVGAVNGFFVAFLRIQSIVATLSTMFLLRGLALLVLPEPGGSVPQDVTSFFTGAAIPQILPAALVVILVAIAVWIAIKRTRFGTAIYAVGSDEESAERQACVSAPQSSQRSSSAAPILAPPDFRQRPIGRRRSVGWQSHASRDFRSGRARRHGAGRGARRLHRTGVRCIHFNAHGEHIIGTQHLGLLQHNGQGVILILRCWPHR